MLLPVIMAGGAGSRLWPMSRELYPKQFLKLHGVHSMLQATLKRLDGVDVMEPVVICNEDHRFLVAEQLRQLNKLSRNIILEPVGRNTAPAIALAALNAVANGDDPTILVLAADHIISDISAFHEAIKKAIPSANEGRLVTFGIVPTGAVTGYGYIHRGKTLTDKNQLFEIKRFVEKPDLATAEAYVASGEYYWNSGMFMFRAKQYLQELGKFRPDILDVCQQAMDTSCSDNDFITIDKKIFETCPSESIDYAVMEKTAEAIVVPLDAGWSDVGSWSALWEVSHKDALGNAISGDSFLSDTKNCYINTDEKLIAVIGVENLVIVNTKDAVLVVDKSKVQDVKKIVEYLKNNNRSEYRRHRESYRPWGRSDMVVSESRFNVNRITVKP
ncbi:mannose-1-phosphate guanylyltransferase/mannose-6-phosphate isomerase, partial [Yersinia bercovieri]